MVDEQSAVFLEEANELLIELESALMTLEENPSDSEMIDRVFRAMHTIKGSGAMFGFDEISAFTHEIETVFDLVRGGSITAGTELIDLCLKAQDQIRAMLDAYSGTGEVNPDYTRELVESFRNFLPESGWENTGVNSCSSEENPVSTDPGEMEQNIYRVFFKPDTGIFQRGINPVSIIRELSELGSAKVIAHPENVPPFDELDPEKCFLSWDIILTSCEDENAIRDVFIFVEDESEIRIQKIGPDDIPAEGESHKKLGEILVERGDLSSEALDEFLGKRKLIGEMLVEAGLVSPDQIEAALAEQEAVKKQSQKRSKTQAGESSSSIRVPADRLDKLVDLVGELVTVQSRLSQTSAEYNNSDFLAIGEEVERLTAELRDITLNIRMLPIGTTFNKFKRLVRDLSRELGKEIEFSTSGGETEVDKTVIEKLNDPLVHIIRNSIDHGVESPEERERQGKSRQGTVRLEARHSGDSVIIGISDDGKGLDSDAVLRKAIEQGKVGADEQLSDQEIMQLIFASGVSTAGNVTNVSGRGVGMDVVKQGIESLRGTIQVTSAKGEGTTIQVKIPLTLAIVESLQVKIGGEHFLLPLSMVEECIELTSQDVADSHGRDLVRVRDNLVPYLSLRKIYEVNGRRPDMEQVVIVQCEGNRVGLAVDNVIGEHQTVIKSLGRLYRDTPGFSGATILGDGSVALILDVSHLVKQAEHGA